ncbi:MAG: DUF4328 domain-containing protein [Aureispira sp.]|nr:DUF4328 domain-containing protein [Aureispira sp.]
MNTTQSQVFVGKIEKWIKPFIGLSVVSLIGGLLRTFYFYYAIQEDITRSLSILNFLDTWRPLFFWINFVAWIINFGIIYLFLKWLAGMGELLRKYKKTGVNPLEGLGFAFFIPIANWFIPYRGIRSFFRYTIYAQANINDADIRNLRLESLNKTKTKYDKLLIYWWVSWLLASNLWLLIFILKDYSFVEDIALLFSLIGILKSVFWCISAWLLLNVIKGAQEEAKILEKVVEHGENLDSDQDLYDTLIL